MEIQQMTGKKNVSNIVNRLILTLFPITIVIVLHFKLEIS